MKKYIKEFSFESSYLTKDELIILDKLIEAARLISVIYETQLENEGFYPKDASRAEIEKAAINNPEILSPYTVVQRDDNGKLIAIPYHIKYKKLLLPVVKLLTDAAQVSIHRKDFRKALLVQAKALLNGDYDKAQSTWMQIKPYAIDIVIGPIERIEDNLFFVKRSYQAWVGLMNKNLTTRMTILKDIVFSARKGVLISDKLDFMDKAQLRVDDTIIFSGMIANYRYTATTLPNEVDLLERFGSEAWIFLPSVHNNLKNNQLPQFKKIFESKFRSSFMEQDLLRGYLLMIIMHEIARVVVRYRLAISRLKEYYPVFNELTVELLGLKMAGMLLVKGVISQTEMEAAMVMFLTRMFDGYQGGVNKMGSKPLVLGNAIVLNSLIKSGALKVSKEGISWPNFTKMFISIAELAENMEKILAQGTYNDAKQYIANNSMTSVFKNFPEATSSLHKRN